MKISSGRGDFVSAKGLGPLTNGLKGRCSTIELRALRFTRWNWLRLCSIFVLVRCTKIRVLPRHVHYQDHKQHQKREQCY